MYVQTRKEAGWSWISQADVQTGSTPSASSSAPSHSPTAPFHFTKWCVHFCLLPPLPLLSSLLTDTQGPSLDV